MDRFIEVTGPLADALNWSLKSNMDRFIGSWYNILRLDFLV